MKYKTEREKDSVKTYDYYPDLLDLSSMEKRFIFETAEKLMKIQKESNVLLTEAKFVKEIERRQSYA